MFFSVPWDDSCLSRLPILKKVEFLEMYWDKYLGVTVGEPVAIEAFFRIVSKVWSKFPQRPNQTITHLHTWGHSDARVIVIMEPYIWKEWQPWHLRRSCWTDIIQTEFFSIVLQWNCLIHQSDHSKLTTFVYFMNMFTLLFIVSFPIIFHLDRVEFVFSTFGNTRILFYWLFLLSYLSTPPTRDPSLAPSLSVWLLKWGSRRQNNQDGKRVEMHNH